MKMRVRGLTLGGVPFGGASCGGGTHIGLNTECKILVSYRNVCRHIL